MLFRVFDSRFEVISADSMDVYKNMDIGTAKPDKSLLEHITHHLINIVDPDRQFNAGEFVEKAGQSVKDILNRRKIPLIVGGTAFYIRNFIFGMPDSPRSNKKIRENLYKKLKKYGLKRLYDRLATIDPDYARKIGERDQLRIIRALEIYEATGLPVSSYNVPDRLDSRYAFLLLGLFRPREDLNARINERVDVMFNRGLVKEVKELIRAGYTFSDPGMKGIGYREFGIMRTGCLSYNNVREMIKAHTRQYAKRQMTFFKAFPEVNWIDADDYGGITELVKDFLASNLPAGSEFP